MSLLDPLLAPFTNDALFVALIWQFAVLLLIIIALDLVVGYGGMFQLGHTGFFALGALGTTLGTHPSYLGLDMFGGILLGMTMTTLAVILIGGPTLRLTGDHFAIATFGFALSVQAVFIGLWATGIYNVPQMNPFGCDPACLADTRIGNVIGETVSSVLFVRGVGDPARTGVELALLGAFVIPTYILLGRLKHSPLGRVLKSVREDPRAAMSLGKNVQLLRFKALWISALVQSLAGSLYVHFVRNFSPHYYGFDLLILTLLAAILGGLGSHAGAFLGALLLVVINEQSLALSNWVGREAPALAANYSIASLRLVFFGALLIALMILRPNGILGDRELTIRSMWTRWRERKRGHVPSTEEGP